jgi:ribA/ribD-fused uncharacterized protein
MSKGATVYPTFTVPADAITSFKGTFLSNMVGGVEYLFVAAKTDDPAEKARVMQAKTPYDAKRLGRAATLRLDWEQIKVIVMIDLIAQKFAPGSEYAEKLLATGDVMLVEGNTWNDRIWGAVWDGKQWVGHNHLGKILMGRRAELRETPKLMIAGICQRLCDETAPKQINGWYRVLHVTGSVELAEGVETAVTDEVNDDPTDMHINYILRRGDTLLGISYYDDEDHDVTWALMNPASIRRIWKENNQ